MLSALRSAVVLHSRRHKDVATCSIAGCRLMGDPYRCKSTQAFDGGEDRPTGPPKATGESELSRTGRSRPKIDRSRVPVINEDDLDEFFISGHGPGGQNVNKAINCCQVRHRPTGIVVKVHHTRSLQQNRQIARELLTTKLDNLYNGEASVENQKKRLALQHMATRESQSATRRLLKEQYKRKLATDRESNQDEHLL